MNRLFKLEYYKNLNYRPFIVFAVLYFLILIALLFIGLVDINLFGGLKINLKEQGFYDFPGIWNFTTYIVALLKIFLGLIIVFSICQEFTNRMFKQNTIDGLSRGEFVASKVLTITIFTTISTLMVFAVTLALGLNYSKTTANGVVTKELFFIANYFVKLFAFFAFLMFLSVLFRKSVFVLLAFFVWWIAESIIGGVESFARLKGLDEKSSAELLNNGFIFSKLLPLESMSSLIPNPMLRLNIAKTLGMEYHFSYPWPSLVAAVLWTAVFIYGSYWILKKRDW